MTLQQTLEIPASRRVHFDLPRDIPVGAAKFELTITPFLAWDTVPQKAAEERVHPLNGLREGSSLTPAEALKEMFGCCADTGDTLDGYLARHWADNDLERAIELRREQEREQMRHKHSENES
jgi:hypothetical protein